MNIQCIQGVTAVQYGAVKLGCDYAEENNAVTSRPAIRTGEWHLRFRHDNRSKGDDMKKLLVGMLAILMLAMAGCGGGSVEVVVPVAPVV